jgi:hypothetical protein
MSRGALDPSEADGSIAVLAGSSFARFGTSTHVFQGGLASGPVEGNDLRLGLARQLTSVAISNATDHLDGPHFS